MSLSLVQIQRQAEEIQASGLSVNWCPICKASTGDYATHRTVKQGAVEEHECIQIDVVALIGYVDELRSALEFYAEPMTYFGVELTADEPHGDFLNDVELNPRWGESAGIVESAPGRRARSVLSEWTEA